MSLVLPAVADHVIASFELAEAGHCARVDYLDRDEARALCQLVRQKAEERHLDLDVHVLEGQADPGEFGITTDKAIELRNRKRRPLCLLVPNDLVDSAASSLTNSFAILDGRALHRSVLRDFVDALPEATRDASSRVLGQVARLAMVSDDWKLDFVAEARRLADGGGDLSKLGMELWRVGLVSDAAPDFVERLDRNRRAVEALVKPLRATLAPTDRLNSLGLDATTVRVLRRFFQARPMQAVREWSKALRDGAGPTFDLWMLTSDESRDLAAFFVKSFLGKDGAVEKYCKLSQPDAEGGPLFAKVGQKSAVVVKWVTEPVAPADVARWRVELIPSTDDSDLSFEFPTTEVSGAKRQARIRLELDADESFDFGVRIRLVPLDNSGSEIALPDSTGTIDLSEEFFLTTEVDDLASSVQETRRESPSIAYGRLETAMLSNTADLIEAQPQWSRREMDYFTLRLNERRLVSIGISRFLRDTQEAVIASPRTGGRFTLDVSEIAPAAFIDCRALELGAAESEHWQAFLRAREAFFMRIRKATPRDTVESADWSSELAGYGIRYAQAYTQLATAAATPSELTDVLSLDTILVRIGGANATPEEALLILPTHPVRVAWMAGYTQLLATWERQVLELGTARDRAIDLLALRNLAPSNAPAFAVHPESPSTFTFFENIRFSTGLALPPDVPDPYRRLSDLCAVLAVAEGRGVVADSRPTRVAQHFQRYGSLHPSVATIATVLVNPDQGELFAEAAKQYIAALRKPDEAPPTPRLAITAYVRDLPKAAMTGLHRLRELRAEDPDPEPGDAFRPGVATTVKAWSALAEPLPDAHFALVSDFTAPSVRSARPAEASLSTSIGLYGLLARFIAASERDLAGHKWTYRISPNSSTGHVPHPAGPKYSDTLIAAHAASLAAAGRRLTGDMSAESAADPVIEVTLSAAEERVLAQLHGSADWVITLDRYFGMDYYDSPYTPHLSASSQRYLIDYSPEVADGQGHRIIVTTAWREEIQAVLSRALRELHFDAIDQSVGHLLHHLKTVSGRLALEAMGSSTSATAAASLGVVTAWLQAQGRLQQSVLIPVDLHPRLFSRRSDGSQSEGERRCDLALVSLRRGIVEAAFVEVKWRQPGVSVEGLASEIVMQTTASGEVMRQRFFSQETVDGAFQRAHLASVLTFYLERCRRYQLFDEAAVPAFLEHITRLEKTGLSFRPTYEGYVVSLEDRPRKPIVIDDAKIMLLTARDFLSTEGLRPEHSFAGDADAKEPDGDANETGADSPENEVGDDHVTRGSSEAVDASSTAEPVTSGEVEIPLGNAPGGTVSWSPRVEGSPHIFVSGIPGQGKSWTLLRMVRELSRQHVPSLVLDFHGQFAAEAARGVLDATTVLDVTRGLPFSPFECSREPGPTDWRGNAYAIAEIFGYVVGLGDMQRDVVYSAARDAYRAAGFEEDGRAGPDYPSIGDLMARIEVAERTRRVSNVSARCRPLLEHGLFRADGEPEGFVTALRQGLVIDLSKLYLDTLQVAACAFVLRKTYRETLRWGASDRIRLAVVVDEGHRVARDTTLPKLMKEGRKFGVAIVVASQGLADFHTEVLGNAGSKVVFRSNFPESKRAAGLLRARPGVDLAAGIEQLGVGAAYVQTPDMSLASKVEMLPLDD